MNPSIPLTQWSFWLQDARKMSSHTVGAYEVDIQQFVAFQNGHCGKSLSVEELSNLTVQDFRAWLAYRSKEKYSPRSTARALSAVRNFFGFLTTQGFSPNTALANIRSPRIKAGLPRPLSINQAKNLIDDIGLSSEEAWIGWRNRALFVLLYSAGLRLGEALGLARSQAPLETSSLLIHGKGNRERVVPILPIVNQAIQDYLHSCPFDLAPQGPLFIGAKGKKLHPGIAQKAIRDYRRAVGLPETATPHALRHSCATHLMGASGDLRAIQELLGHVSLSTTQVYTDVDMDHLMKVYRTTHPRAKLEPPSSKD